MKTIREHREGRGWTQFELALKVGVQPQAVYLWESDRRPPRVPQLRKLGALFGICSDEIEFVATRSGEGTRDRVTKVKPWVRAASSSTSERRRNPIMRRHCAEPGCTVAAGRVRCQDCGKAFCGGHIGAVEFSGPRSRGAPPTAWTRFVCTDCARRAVRRATAATAHAAHDQARRDAQGSWWDKR